MQPFSMDTNRANQAYQALIQIGKTPSGDRARLGFDERMGCMIIHSGTDQQPKNVHLIEVNQLEQLLVQLHKDLADRKIPEDIYLQVMKGARKVAETHSAPGILESAKKALGEVGKNPTVNSTVIAKASEILGSTPQSEAEPKSEASLRERVTTAQLPANQGVMAATQRWWGMNRFAYHASETTLGFLPPDMDREKIDNVMKILIKDEKSYHRYMDVLQAIVDARKENMKMLQKGTSPTSTDKHYLQAASLAYTLIGDIGQSAEDSKAVKPAQAFLESLLEIAGPNNTQVVADVFMLGVGGAPTGTEARAVDRSQDLKGKISNYNESQQALISANFMDRGEFGVWERARWRPLLEIPVSRGERILEIPVSGGERILEIPVERILLRGQIIGDFSRPESSSLSTHYVVPVDITSLGDPSKYSDGLDMEYLSSLSYSNYRAIYSFLKSFISHPAEKASPIYQGETLTTYKFEENDARFIDQERENIFCLAVTVEESEEMKQSRVRAAQVVRESAPAELVETILSEAEEIRKLEMTLVREKVTDQRDKRLIEFKERKEDLDRLVKKNPQIADAVRNLLRSPLDWSQYDRLVGIGYNVRSRVDRELCRSMMQLYAPQLFQ